MTGPRPPCFLAAADPRQALDVARWRRAERQRLFALREGLGQAGRGVVSTRIAAKLPRVLADLGLGRGSVLSGYWPIKGEPDLRPALAALHAEGVILALPVVETRAAPLVFRRWTPGMALVRGDWNIPVPPPGAEVLTPDAALAPCLGWSEGGYRLGWGGGYFDRTLAVLAPRPLTLGIAIGAARLETIFPQPHDIPLDLILTEDGILPAVPVVTPCAPVGRSEGGRRWAGSVSRRPLACSSCRIRCR